MMRRGRKIQLISILAVAVLGAPGNLSAAPMTDYVRTADAPQIEATPVDAIFDHEEVGVPFLGFADDFEAQAVIGINAPGYQDQFTIYFARGSSNLSRAAADMVDLAAEAVMMSGEVEIWLSAGPALTMELGFDRIDEIKDGLLSNGIPGSWIRIDDGSLDAVLDRPLFLNDDQEI